MLACADIEEGIALRGAGVRAPILVFGALSVSDLDGVFDTTSRRRSRRRRGARAAGRRGEARRAHALPSEDRHRHEPARVPPRQPPGTLPEVAASRTSRSPRSTPTSPPPTTRITRRSRSSARGSSASCSARRDGHHHAARHRHAANSAALLRDERVWYDFVRPGLLLYGIVPPPLAATLDAATCPVTPQPYRGGEGHPSRRGTATGFAMPIRPHARRRPGRLCRRPRSAPGGPRLHAGPRPPRAGRRLGVHGHDDDRRHRHGCRTGRRGRDDRRAGRRVDRRARDRGVDRHDSMRVAVPASDQRVYDEPWSCSPCRSLEGWNGSCPSEYIPRELKFELE